jgi:hypothetical protein
MGIKTSFTVLLLGFMPLWAAAGPVQSFSYASTSTRWQQHGTVLDQDLQQNILPGAATSAGSSLDNAAQGYSAAATASANPDGTLRIGTTAALTPQQAQHRGLYASGYTALGDSIRLTEAGTTELKLAVDGELFHQSAPGMNSFAQAFFVVYLLSSGGADAAYRAFSNQGDQDFQQHLLATHELRVPGTDIGSGSINEALSLSFDAPTQFDLVIGFFVGSFVHLMPDWAGGSALSIADFGHTARLELVAPDDALAYSASGLLAGTLAEPAQAVPAPSSLALSLLGLLLLRGRFARLQGRRHPPQGE